MTSESGEDKITGFYLPGDIVGIEDISDQRHHGATITLGACRT
ncbi:MAG: CRP-like cAMP-binding protein [Granulosicoccus sp.]|jgi:CRP-like cAMP-binding protein